MQVEGMAVLYPYTRNITSLSTWYRICLYQSHLSNQTFLCSQPKLKQCINLVTAYIISTVKYQVPWIVPVVISLGGEDY